MICLCLWALVGETQRFQIDVAWKQTEREFSARIHLNQAEDGRVVLVCRKSMSGSLFKIWLSDELVVLALEDKSHVFIGPGDARFALFPNLPELLAEQWIALLLQSSMPDSIDVRHDEDWMVWHDASSGCEMRWRVKSKSLSRQIDEKIFRPRISDQAVRHALDDLPLLWQE